MALQESISEVLYFAEGLKAKQTESDRTHKENALAVLAKYRGRFNVDKHSLEDIL